MLKKCVFLLIQSTKNFLINAKYYFTGRKKIIRAITMDETSLKLIGKEARKNIIKKFNVEKMCFSTYSEYKKLLN